MCLNSYNLSYLGVISMTEDKQAQLQQLQITYNQLADLQSQLQQTLMLWQNSAELQQTLSDAYDDDSWLATMDAATQQNLMLDTDGHYCILSQDAIWNVLADNHALAMQLLKQLSNDFL